MRDVQCKNCIRLKSEWCAMKNDSPEPELIRDCQYFKQMTNADRIRAMSDEKLAELLNRVKEPCDFCQLAGVEGACTETLCDYAMTKWLQQPAEEETI